MSPIYKDGKWDIRIFERIPPLVAGVSTRSMGDMRQTSVRDTLPYNIITPQKQLHGTKVVEITSLPVSSFEGDGIFMASTIPAVIGVVVADCLPILLADTAGRACAVVHAGWKGALNGVVENALSLFSLHGVKNTDILVHIGPHICGTCYQVTEERAAQFLAKFGQASGVSYKKDAVWHVSLAAAVRSSLLSFGVQEEHIEENEICTFHDEVYFSYRRDYPDHFGEQIGYIGFPFPAPR